MKHWTNIFLIGATVLLLAACSDSPGPATPEPEPAKLSKADPALLNANNNFCLDILHEFQAAEPDKSFFYSPLSISMALGMTMNGAEGYTKEGMQQALRLDNLSDDQINAGYRLILDLLPNVDRKVALDIANSIWVRDGFPVDPAFLQRCKDSFSADARNLDFADLGSVDVINNWVKAKTRDKIDGIVAPPIPDAAIMYLINAVYFKGPWKIQFDPAVTRDDVFRSADGSTVPMRLMVQSDDDIRYMENNLFQAVDLAYGNGSFSMTIILPKEGNSVADVISEASPSSWNQWMAQFEASKVDLGIPRFKFEYEKSLKDILKVMGMGLAFEGGAADFSRISKTSDLFISDVKHKTFVEVNEEGTEAAAVTSVEVSITSVDPDRKSMYVDHPFLFAIRERETGTILFLGKMLSL